MGRLRYLKCLDAKSEESALELRKYQARRICAEVFCKHECLISKGYEYGHELVQQCIDELKGMTRKEKKNHLLQKMRSFYIGTSSKGYLKMKWTVGEAPLKVMENVCRDCFAAAYAVGHCYVEVLCCVLKAGEKHVDAPLSDVTPPVISSARKELIELAARFDIDLSPQQLAALTVPNTIASLTCFAWMQSFFNAVGDQQPNHNEIHLEPISIKEVHKEYSAIVGDLGEPVLQYSSFLNMWDVCFPHVKIREFKAVSGKCKTCTELSEARRKQLSMAGRRYLTELHALHRTMYMGERMGYYERRNQAMLMPSEYWSGIGDGFMQNHCLLPHRGNLSQFSECLPQHIQGIISHGRSIQMYRTFHNIINNANLSIHCLLLSLQRLIDDEGRVPDVLYYQVDGGSENTANAVFGIVELIIVRGLAKRVVITRLPVGHTHEDIDSKFAVIWKRIRNDFVLTPLQYAAAIEECLTTNRTKCNVTDIFVIPDYCAYITPCMDPDFGRYAKSEWTQHQWEFCSVAISDSFPLGCKTTYRKYSQDEIILIEQSETEGALGFKALKASVTIQPAAVPPHVPEGMFLLRVLPQTDAVLAPQPFVEGSRAKLEKVVQAIEKHFKVHMPSVVTEWHRFRDDIAPQSDSVADYVAAKGMYIPLYDRLFNTTQTPIVGPVDALSGSFTVVPERVSFTNSVTWNNRGKGKTNSASKHAYVGANTADSATSAPIEISRRKRRRSRSPSLSQHSNDSSDEDGTDTFFYHDMSTTDSRVSEYVKYVNRKFNDTQDNITYKVVGICEVVQAGKRKSSNPTYAFKYIPVNDDYEADSLDTLTDFEYTPVREMLNSYWCEWHHVDRLSRRTSVQRISEIQTAVIQHNNEKNVSSRSLRSCAKR